MTPSLTGWQQLVLDSISSDTFTNEDLYAHEDEFRARYPDNENPRAKIRQALQDLRDLGLLEATGTGEWRRTSAITTAATRGGLEPQVEKTLRETHARLTAEGKLLAPAQLDAYHALFRDRFGLERLRALDGEELLERLHGTGSKESLVYWLEFKDDDEFPTRQFGGIGGGSALKYGMYRRADNRTWMTGSPQKQRELSVGEAVKRARQDRQQLEDAAAALEKLPENANDGDYVALEKDIERVAPDLAHLAWAHKYLSLLFPEKLDDYHGREHQDFHLVKLLVPVPAARGGFVCAARFVTIARQLGWPVGTLTSVLNAQHGARHAYWIVGVDPVAARPTEAELLSQGVVGLGEAALGDLSTISGNKWKEQLRARILGASSGIEPPRLNRLATDIGRFLYDLRERDIVAVAERTPDGQVEVQALGRVLEGDYGFDANALRPHRRATAWLANEKWRLPVPEGLEATFGQLWRSENLVEIERRIQGKKSLPVGTSPRSSPDAARAPRPDVPPLEHELRARLQGILKRKGQAILYGPPGTGKTYHAEATARDLAALRTFGKPWRDLGDAERRTVHSTDGHGLVRACSFHPGYGYEDFIEGYRPGRGDAGMEFTLRDGIFKVLCTDAGERPDDWFFLIIDELNRGDVPRIFGELLTAIERDKRGKHFLLPLSGTSFQVPPNVFLIGTMNTADRSIALLDAALRRRFGFLELMPAPELLDVVIGETLPLGEWLRSLNERICRIIGRDARNLQVGHAYFLKGEAPVQDVAGFVRILREDVVPLLEEYCYEDYARLAEILGEGLVDTANLRIQEELFETSAHEDLLRALLKPDPRLMTSARLVAREGEATEE